jgi:hypothetical protein
VDRLVPVVRLVMSLDVSLGKVEGSKEFDGMERNEKSEMASANVRAICFCCSCPSKRSAGNQQ